jgi:hypothetical protein
MKMMSIWGEIDARKNKGRLCDSMLAVWNLHCNPIFGKEDWTIRKREEGMGITIVEIKRAVTRRDAWRPRAVVGKDVNERKPMGWWYLSRLRIENVAVVAFAAD